MRSTPPFGIDLVVGIAGDRLADQGAGIGLVEGAEAAHVDVDQSVDPLRPEARQGMGGGEEEADAVEPVARGAEEVQHIGGRPAVAHSAR